MRTVTVEVDVDVEDVIENLDDEELQAVLRRCGRADALPGDTAGAMAHLSNTELLERSYYAMRGRDDLPPELREYFWRALGRIA